MSAARARAGSAVAGSDRRVGTCDKVTDESTASVDTPEEQAPPHIAWEAAPCAGTLEVSWEAASAARHTTGQTAASNPTNTRMRMAIRRVMPGR